MLNFLCSEINDIEELFSIFGFFIAIVFVVIAIFSKMKFKSQDTSNDDDDDEYPFGSHPNSQGFMTEEQRRYQNTLKQRKGANKKPTAPSATGSDGHSHQGEVENYDPIVGSLGNVSDEGCDELNGVRLIVTDLVYETDDEQIAYDLQAIGKSMILGEVLNNPRFKTPYGKK